MNTHMIMLQTDQKFYFYRLGATKLKYLLFAANTKSSLAVLNQGSPQAIVVGNHKSIAYLVSNGYLQVNKPQATQNITLTATSVADNGYVTCFVQFQVNIV
jgi:hypothetical protein